MQQNGRRILVKLQETRGLLTGIIGNFMSVGTDPSL
jgi:hypothetical protein